MKDILVFAALVLFIIVPIAVFFSWLFFKRTTAFLNSILLNWHAITVALLTYSVAKLGIGHIIWASPVAILFLILELWIYHKKISKPIKSLTVGINELEKGNFEIKFDNKIQKQQNEVGIIAKSLNQMLSNLQRSSKITELVAKGNLYSAAAISDNITQKGSLDKAMHEMIQKLKNSISTINESSVLIAAGASEINTSSQSVASGANQQAVSLEELSASMEEMVVGIKQNADNAEVAGRMAEKSAKDIKAVSESVAIAVEAMQQIADRIIVMQDIAKKTDMLAINASIEASRAGNLGKGFASVALEVRRLAENANSAAMHITELAHKTSQNAVLSKEQLNAVIPDILETSDVVQEIALASSEQNEAASQVNAAISQLNQVTQQNASAAEELAGSSEEFNQQADQLKQTIAFFKLTQASETLTKEKLLKRIEQMNLFIEENFSDEDNIEGEIAFPEENLPKKEQIHIDISENKEDDNFEMMG